MAKVQLNEIFQPTALVCLVQIKRADQVTNVKIEGRVDETADFVTIDAFTSFDRSIKQVISCPEMRVTADGSETEVWWSDAP